MALVQVVIGVDFEDDGNPTVNTIFQLDQSSIRYSVGKSLVADSRSSRLGFVFAHI